MRPFREAAALPSWQKSLTSLAGKLPSRTSPTAAAVIREGAHLDAGNPKGRLRRLGSARVRRKFPR